MKRVTFWAANLSLTTLLLFTVIGCKTVPETGRKQFNFVSSDQAAQLGLSSFTQMKQEVPISKDPAANALLQKVGKRIAAVAELPNAQWEFVVFDSKQANAFCLPGGKIGIYTGILPVTKDEAGLATVLGHEVAHAVAQHGGERISEAMALQGLGNIVGATMGDSKWQAATMAAYGLGTQVAVALPHSRKQESEADEIGLKYMARAGYDPEQAIKFWERFSDNTAAAGGDKTPGFLRTHPVDKDRIEHLRELMPEAKAEYQKAKSR